MESLVGRILDGRFQIVKSIGAGGMGEVFLANHLETGLSHAVKLMQTDRQGAERAAGRFRREAQVLSRLNHENIVDVLDFGAAEDGLLFLAMEYIDGLDLEDQIVTGGTFSLGDSLRVLKQASQALAYAHQQGVVHRDLKPANIVLQGGSPARIRIIDFGLAKILTDRTVTVLTTQHAAIGTPLYMPPEQFLAGEIGPAADIYALAGVAYFMVAGQPVFPARSKTEIVLAHCRKEPPRLSELCTEVTLPERLDRLLLRSLAKDPQQRPTAEEISAELFELDQQVGDDGHWHTVRATRRAVWRLPRGDADVEDLIWSDSRSAASAEAELSQEVVIQQGLHNQITALLITLSAKAADRLADAVPLRALVSEVDDAQAQISDLEIDLALLDSELVDDPSADPSASAVLNQKRQALEDQIAGLGRTLNTCYRQLYQQLGELKAQVADAELQRLFGDLDALVREFVVSSSG